MAKHLPYNKKIKLTMESLRGMSYASISQKYDVPETTVRDICKAHFEKCFFNSELDKLTKSNRNLKGYRKLLAESVL